MANGMTLKARKPARNRYRLKLRLMIHPLLPAQKPGYIDVTLTGAAAKDAAGVLRDHVMVPGRLAGIPATVVEVHFAQEREFKKP